MHKNTNVSSAHRNGSEDMPEIYSMSSIFLFLWGANRVSNILSPFLAFSMVSRYTCNRDMKIFRRETMENNQDSLLGGAQIHSNSFHLQRTWNQQNTGP